MNPSGDERPDGKVPAAAPPPRAGWIGRVLERSAVPPRPVVARQQRPEAEEDVDATDRMGPPAEFERAVPRPAMPAPAPQLPAALPAPERAGPLPQRVAPTGVERSGPALQQPVPPPPLETHRRSEAQELTPPRRHDVAPPEPAPTPSGVAEAGDVRPAPGPEQFAARELRPPAAVPAPPEDDAPRPRARALDAPPAPESAMPPPPHAAAIAELAPPMRADVPPAAAAAPPPARLQIGRITVEVTPPPVAPAAARAPVGPRTARATSGGRGARSSPLRFGLGAS